MLQNTYLRELINDGLGIIERHTHVVSVGARKVLIVCMSPLLVIRHAQGIRAGAPTPDPAPEPAPEPAPAPAPEPPRPSWGLQPDGREILDYTEMFITAYCSIDCKWCSASIPYYYNKYHIPTELLLAQTKRYLDAIDGVETFRLLGGEPFLHPDLDKILQPLIDSPKVGSVRLVTNGTIVPKKPALLAQLVNPKVVLDVSYYGEVSDKLDQLLELEKQGKMHVNVAKVGYWFVPNHVYTDKGLTEEQVFSRYRSCPDYCHVLRNGKFFYCGEAFHIANIPDSPMEAGVDFVDIMDENLTPADLKKQINDLVFKRAGRMNACSRCVGSFIHKDRTELIPGEQLKPGEGCPFELPMDIPVVSTKKI